MKPTTLPPGFYIEIKNKGKSGRGVRMRFNTKEDMERTIKQYESFNKEVIILGEY